MAKAFRKRLARLQRRQKAWDSMNTDNRMRDWPAGYKRPGSFKKSFPKGKR